MGRGNNDRSVRLRTVAGVAALVLAGCTSGSGSASPPRTMSVPTELTPSSVASGATSGTAVPRDWSEELVALATGAAGDRGVWRSTALGRWVLALSAPTATAVARFGDTVATAGPGHLETARLGDASAITPLPLDWTAADAETRVAAIARAPGGRLAVATYRLDRLIYFVAGDDSVLRQLEQAPSQSFAPSVAWLDDDRLLVLATDETGASRLLEIDVAAGSLGRTGGTSGLRDFALSGDTATLAAVTARNILAGDPAEFLGGSPQVVGAVPDGEIAWGLALDRTGSMLALVEAVVADDGTAVQPHLVVFRRAAGKWSIQLDEPLPLTAIAGLAWAPRV
jgi:hypothetical protein